MTDHSSSVEIFHGSLSPVQANVYVRLAEHPGGGDQRLEGSIRGPICRFSHTLPAVARLHDQGAGPTLLARATVTDPCFWSPSLPALYQVHVELFEGGRRRWSIDRETGFRFLGAAGAHLRLESRRWVLRGVAAGAPPLAEISRWREAGAALIVPDPDSEFLAEAARQGLLIVSRLDRVGLGLNEERPVPMAEANLLRRLSVAAQSPAVAMAILPTTSLSVEQLRRASGNLLLGTALGNDGPIERPQWADVLYCHVSDPRELARHFAGCDVPLIATRDLGTELDVTEARAMCDRLQRDLASIGDFAGYVMKLPSGR